MNQIEKLHLDIIKHEEVSAVIQEGDRTYFVEDNSYFDVAIKSAAITEQIALEFGGWINRNYRGCQGDWVPTLERIAEIEGIRRDIVLSKDKKSTQEIYQEFLKTKL